MDENQKNYTVNLGKWGTVTIAGVLGLLAGNLVTEIQSCRNAGDDAQVDAGVPDDDGDVDEQPAPEMDASIPEVDSAIEPPV